MDWKVGPPVLVGERVSWSDGTTSGTHGIMGIIKWIGQIPEFGNDWSVGIELDLPLPDGGCDGFWQKRKLFECQEKRGKIVPISQIKKLQTKPYNDTPCIESHSEQNLDVSQRGESTTSDLKNVLIKKGQETKLKDRYSALESKLSEWTFRTRTHARRNTCDDKIRFGRGKKTQDGKSSLKKKGRNRKSLHECDYKFSSTRVFEDDLQLVRKSLDNYSYFTINEAFEPPKSCQVANSSMNDVVGLFKQIREDDGDDERRNGKSSDECDKQLNGLLALDYTDSGHPKEKKFFSFLKWFKKTKENSNSTKTEAGSSVTSSPLFEKKINSSCDSLDTIFSTQTVRSFAYIPPTQYLQPSAPPSSLLDLDKCGDSPIVDDTTKETEPIYDRKKKRKAPQPPRLSRENSLPTTLEHKKKDDDFLEDDQTYHRRTLSESFKDKKAGAYCHVQGKRKAPLPPSSNSIYPSLPKLNSTVSSPCQTLQKKKKPAPPPPDPKEPRRKPTVSNGEEKADSISPQLPNEAQSPVSVSPLPLRPWYKRNNKDSTGGSNSIKKDLFKGFDKKKSKDADDWMPEAGFSRRSFSTDTNHSKFNIFSKLDKNQDKKKEEKRKSQISILTNISELDKEAAEIMRKGQAEEKKIMEEKDAMYYTPNSADIFNELLLNVNETKKGGKNLSEEVPKPETSTTPGQTGPVNNLYGNEPEGTGIYDNYSPQSGITDTARDALNADTSKGKSDDVSSSSGSTMALGPVSSTSTPDARPTALTDPNSSTNLNEAGVKNKETFYLNDPWVCSKCTLENAGWRVFCEICSSVKPKFLYNFKEKTLPKPEPVDKSNENANSNLTSAESNGAEVKNSSTSTTKGNEKMAADFKEGEQETLDDLRKKRMTFFNSILEDHGNIPVPKLDQPTTKTEDEQVGLKKVLKDMKDSLPKRQEHSERKMVNGEEPEKVPDRGTKKVETATVSGTNESQSTVGGKPATPGKDKVIEAYVVTKTTILEDIIIKKADKPAKVSASSQTTLPGVPKKSDQAASQDVKKSDILAMPGTSKDFVKERKLSLKEPIDLSPGSEEVNKGIDTQEDLEELTNKLTQAKGLEDFKATIKMMPPNTQMNTVAVNRLLRKLETAINGGDHLVAAGLAKELAMLKINCSVTRQAVQDATASASSNITIYMYIEDKESHRGPIQIRVSPTMTLLQLKTKVQQEFDIPINIQRWILGKTLATDDHKTLESDGVKKDFCSVFLYLVTSGNEEGKTNNVDQMRGAKLSPERTNAKQQDNGKGEYLKKKGGDQTPENVAPSAIPQNLPSQVEASSSSAAGTSFPGTRPVANGQVDKPSVFDLKIRDPESDLEKELKVISVNSVKQKVEQLNRTFAENSGLRPPDTWKCSSCSYVNYRGRQWCFSCNADKPAVKPANPPKARRAPKPPISGKSSKDKNGDDANSNNFHYKALMELQDADLVPNVEPFNCPVCLVDYSPGEGVILKDCLHTFCRPCLVNTVQYSEDAEVKCPYIDETYNCNSVMQQREIKSLVPQKIFDLHLAKSVKEAENKIGNAFHCKTPDCKGWCIYEDNVNEFHCPVCNFNNCLTCHAIHTGINCRQYQEQMKDASETDMDAKKTRIMLEEMVEKGEAMACPKCQVVLMKKWGCDWLRCSMCKTEICWVTRGFRWGPGGKGDTSGGCKCGVNGVKCHPKCNYCH